VLFKDGGEAGPMPMLRRISLTPVEGEKIQRQATPVTMNDKA
jgi:hypothetical protein